MSAAGSYTPLHSAAAGRTEERRDVTDKQRTLYEGVSNPPPTVDELYDPAGTVEALLKAGANWKLKGW